MVHRHGLSSNDKKGPSGALKKPHLFPFSLRFCASIPYPTWFPTKYHVCPSLPQPPQPPPPISPSYPQPDWHTTSPTALMALSLLQHSGEAPLRSFQLLVYPNSPPLPLQLTPFPSHFPPIPPFFLVLLFTRSAAAAVSSQSCNPHHNPLHNPQHKSSQPASQRTIKEVLQWPYTMSRGGTPPWTPRPPPSAPTKVTIVGRNEIYNRENSVRPFLVHKLLGPRRHPPRIWRRTIPSTTGQMSWGARLACSCPTPQICCSSKRICSNLPWPSGTSRRRSAKLFPP